MEEIQVYYCRSDRKMLLQDLAEDLEWNRSRGVFFNETQANANAPAGISTSRLTTTTTADAAAATAANGHLGSLELGIGMQ